MRRFRRIAPFALIGIAVALIAFIYDPRNLFDDNSTPAVEVRDTSTVEARSLGQTFTADGMVVYTDATTAFVRLETQSSVVSATPGTGSALSHVTQVVVEGATVDRGDVLWRLGNEPTVALFGELPNYRDLGPGDEGTDVLQLETNLVALGFDPTDIITVDETFTTSTEAMVERWQDAIGAEPTGRVDTGAVVYITDTRRVGPVSVAVGESVAAGEPMMTLTATDRKVTFSVPAAERGTVADGDRVEIRLPDRTTLTAVVYSIVIDDTGGASVTAQTEEVIEAVADQIPVTVTWSRELATDVVTVPESALIRTDSAQYNVEVRGPDGIDRLVPVEVAANADGWVEVIGGVSPGDEVIAP